MHLLALWVSQLDKIFGIVSFHLGEELPACQVVGYTVSVLHCLQRVIVVLPCLYLSNS